MPYMFPLLANLALERPPMMPRTQVIGTSDDGEPIDEADHFEVCPTCGQMFDMRVLDQVIHHDQPNHKPTELNS